MGGQDYPSKSDASHEVPTRAGRPPYVRTPVHGVADDLAAIGTLSALAERNVRVPEDVSVVGYDNTALAGSAGPTA